jgi:hypothetical protein
MQALLKTFTNLFASWAGTGAPPARPEPRGDGSVPVMTFTPRF